MGEMEREEIASSASNSTKVVPAWFTAFVALACENYKYARK